MLGSCKNTQAKGVYPWVVFLQLTRYMAGYKEGFVQERAQLEEQKARVRDVPVALVIPPSEFLADQRVFPFMGILNVAGELQRNGNYVEVLDFSGVSNYKQLMADYARQRRDIHTFGITATTPQLPASISVLDAIREGSPDAKVILGGTHATLAYTGYTQDQMARRDGRGLRAFNQINDLFDKVVAGDGEMSIFYAIDPNHKKGLINASSRKSNLFIQRGELESFSRPARGLIDEDSYNYQIDGHRAFSVIAQLGCPFECGFCSGRNTDFLRMTRTRSVANVIDEMEGVIKASQERKKPYTAAMFYDDELNIVPNSLEELCRGLMDLQSNVGQEMRFRGFVKAERFSEEQARLMYQAGFRVLLSGVESGSDHILKVIRKKTTSAINEQCLNMAHDAGLQFKALMSIGHPDESERTVAETVDWVARKKPDDFDLTLITPYPGSRYYDNADFDPEKKMWLYTEPYTRGRLWSADMDFRRKAIFYKGIPGEYDCEVETPYLNSKQLVALRDEAESYLRCELKLPAIQSIAAKQFDHSMGQGLSSLILRSTS